MQLLLDKIGALSQYQQLLKQIQAGEEIPGLGLPHATRLPILAALHQNFKSTHTVGHRPLRPCAIIIR